MTSLLPNRAIYSTAHEVAAKLEAHLEAQELRVNLCGLPPDKKLGLVALAVLARRYNVPVVRVFECYRAAYAGQISEFGQRSPLGLRISTLVSKSAFHRTLRYMETKRPEFQAAAREADLVQVNRPVVEQRGLLRMAIDSGSLEGVAAHRKRVEEFQKLKRRGAAERPYRMNPWVG